MGLTETGNRELQIAVVGGGASGTLTAAQLLACAADRRLALHVTLIDRQGRHGLGLAYSTSHPAHLLNAMAGQMSAVPDDPDHLVRWAAAAGIQPDGGRSSDPVTATTFLARRDYGRYLRDVLAEAVKRAEPTARLTQLTGEVIGLRQHRTASGGRARLFLAGIPPVDADVVILATGNAAARLPVDVPPGAKGRVIADPWQPGALEPAIAGAAAGTPVAIVGTGLTMIDLAMTLTDGQPAARVHAISRHGLLPRVHPGTRPAGRPLWLPAISRTTDPVQLADLMWQVRSAISASPENWHAVIDSLRPYLPGLWRRLPERDKRMFLRHVARYWEVHRHLMPPATARRITALKLTGQLTIHSGRIQSVTPVPDGLLLGTDTDPIAAGWLINSTGATGDITAAASPLLRDLFASGQARPDSLRLGIDATPDGAVADRDGQPGDVLFTLGPPLRGLWYETTAIPEIREQAAALARRILSDARVRQQPGSAA